jgi:hypothetical protein
MCEVCGTFSNQESGWVSILEATAGLCEEHQREAPPEWFAPMKLLQHAIDFETCTVGYQEACMVIKFVCLLARKDAVALEAYRELEANTDSIPAMRFKEQRADLDRVLSSLAHFLRDFLVLAGQELGVDVDLVRILAIVGCNSFMVSGFDSSEDESVGYGLALFPPVACKFNHSCWPNAARLQVDLITKFGVAKRTHSLVKAIGDCGGLGLETSEFEEQVAHLVLCGPP